MKKVFIFVVLLGVAAGGFVAPSAHGHAYMVGDNWGDFPAMAAQAQGILDAMMAEFAGCNLWSTSCNGQNAIWSTVQGQRGPAWVPINDTNLTADHGASRTPGWGPERTFVRADSHWAFMEEVLKPGACMEGVPPGRIQEIRNAFNHNKNRVMSTEITVYGVRVRATVLGCDNDITRDITTGGFINFGIKAGTPYPICSTVYTVNEGIPSLFGTGNGGPLLNEAHPQLRDLLANMTAAYMTIGDSRIVDYWYAFMGRLALTFVRELLPGLIANIGKSESEEYEALGNMFYEAMLEGLREIDFSADKDEKAVACSPWGSVDGVDLTRGVPVPVVGNVNVRVTITDSSVCLSIRTFADKFNCSSFACLPEYLAVKNTQGDLNADGRRNIDSWFLANRNLQDWKINEGAGGFLDITTQPVPPGAPINYGGSYGMAVSGVSSVPIAYQWYAGYSPGAMAPVGGAATSSFMAPIDVYSFNGINTYKYFRVDLTAFYCGTNQVVSSNTIQIQGGDPPPITIHDQPEGGNFFPGERVTIKVNASVSVGPGLTYQWQKYNVATTAWDNLPGATTGVLTFEQIEPEDAGQYRVQILNQVAPSPLYWRYSNQAPAPACLVNVAPEIVIAPQPVGAELTIGGSHALVAGASVTDGSLEYRWQRNTGFGYQNLTSWTSAGGLSFVAQYDIASAQISDAGAYRLQVRNTLLPFSPYQANSDPAIITISSGTVYRVDKSAPGPADGLTWATAFTTIQPAIDAAYAQPGGGEVWVAGGPIGAPVVYNEARDQWWGGTTGQPGRVQGSLIMKDNVRVYGGFEGYRGNTGAKEQYRQQRVVYQNRAVIDGSTARGGQPAYHVVVFGRAGNPTVNAALDGFTITGGNASGIPNDYHTWRGGGIYNWQSAPTIANCYIVGNSAAVAGGGIANEGGPWGTAGATIVNCVIQGNHANRAADDFFTNDIPPWRGTAPNPLRGGGGIFINRSNPTMRFLTVRGNTLGAFTPGDPLQWGANTGGIFAWSSGPGEGGGAYNSGNVLLNNAILWENAGGMQYGRNELSTDTCEVHFSNLQGGWSGLGSNNLSSNPNLDADNVPQAGSPVLNSGDPLVPAGEYTDIRGIPRPIDGLVDRGAVEVSTNGPVPVCNNVWIDFIKTPKITDVFDVYNANASQSEAPIWKIELLNKTFNCSSLPQDFTTVTVTDILGRSNFCTSEVNVTESSPPTAVNNPLTVYLTPNNGNYTLTTPDKEYIGAASYDTFCAVAWISVVPSAYTCAQAGRDVWASLLVVDTAGNATSRSTLIRVRDNTPPNAVGSTIDVPLNQFGQYTLTQNDRAAMAAGSTDACGVAYGLTTANMNEFNCAHVGVPVNVAINVYDHHGNMSPAIAQVNVLDVTPPVLFGVRTQSFTSYSGDYTLEQALQGVTAEDLCEGDISGGIMVEVFDMVGNPVDFPVPQSFNTGGLFQYPFTLRYTVLDSSNNQAEVETTLNLYDLALPEITLNGDASVVLECGDEYIDPGATAKDPATGFDVSDQIDTFISVDKDAPGTYAVTYVILIEAFGLFVQEQRIVEVVDTLKPVITLLGNPLMGVQAGTEFVEPGYVAADHCYGDLTGDVVVTGVVDASTPGEYFLYYNVSDGELDADTVTRRVLVGDLFVFTEHPVGKRLYTSDPVYNMGARYVNGLSVSGHEWFRGLDGLGVEPPEMEGNTIILEVNPLVHPLGKHNYRLKVYDELGEYSSNVAQVEVQAPLSALLGDLVLAEGDVFSWNANVEGGLGNRVYQWYRIDNETKGLTPVVNGNYPHPTLGPGKYAGATTAVLGFNPFTEAMAGQYQLEISDDYTTIIAGPATLIKAVGVPAAGITALITLTLAAALGGATTLKKKRSRRD